MWCLSRFFFCFQCCFYIAVMLYLYRPITQWSLLTLVYITYLLIHLGGVMVSIHTPKSCRSWVWFSVWPNQRLYIWICSSDRKAALKSKSNDWLVRKLENVFEWSDPSTCRLLIYWATCILNYLCNLFLSCLWRVTLSDKGCQLCRKFSVSLRVFRFPPQITLTPCYNSHLVQNGRIQK